MSCPNCGKQIVFINITHCAKCNESGCAACLKYKNQQWICEKCLAALAISEEKAVKRTNRKE